MRLIGDMGGTYARFAVQDEPGRYHDVRVFEVRNFAGPGEAIAAYLGDRKVQEAVLAVATPVESDEIRFTNSPWSFSRSTLQAQRGSCAWRS